MIKYKIINRTGEQMLKKFVKFESLYVSQIVKKSEMSVQYGLELKKLFIFHKLFESVESKNKRIKMVRLTSKGKDLLNHFKIEKEVFDEQQV